MRVARVCEYIIYIYLSVPPPSCNDHYECNAPPGHIDIQVIHEQGRALIYYRKVYYKILRVCALAHVCKRRYIRFSESIKSKCDVYTHHTAPQYLWPVWLCSSYKSRFRYKYENRIIWIYIIYQFNNNKINCHRHDRPLGYAVWRCIFFIISAGIIHVP